MQTPPAAVRLTLGFDIRLWRSMTSQAGYNTEQERADALGIHRATLDRVSKGKAAPGPEFIAAVRATFPAADINRLFPVIQKTVAA